MNFTILFAYLPYAIVTAFTPGPNTILSLYAVSQDGWKKGKNAIAGIVAGLFCVMLICAVFCFELARYIPTVAGYRKYIGALYICWLAIKITRSTSINQTEQSVTFWKGFLLEFVNVKLFLYAITIYTGYVIPVNASLSSLIVHSICLTLICGIGCLLWASIGGFFQHFLEKYSRPFNISMGIILFYCAIKLAFF